MVYCTLQCSLYSAVFYVIFRVFCNMLCLVYSSLSSVLFQVYSTLVYLLSTLCGISYCSEGVKQWDNGMIKVVWWLTKGRKQFPIHRLLTDNCIFDTCGSAGGGRLCWRWGEQLLDADGREVGCPYHAFDDFWRCGPK